MLLGVLAEVFIRRIDEPLQLGLCDLSFLVLPDLVCRDNLAVEDLPVHDGEDEVSDEGNRRHAEEGIGGSRCVVKDGPNTTRQATEQLDWCNGGDQAGERVLSADVLCPARLLLAHAEEHDEPGGCSPAEEREVDLRQVADRDWNTSSLIIVEPPSLRATCFTSAIEDIELLRWL